MSASKNRRQQSKVLPQNEGPQFFSFAVFPDEVIPNVNIPELWTTLQQAIDCTRAGVRQRFTVLQKQDLVEWARENKNMNDACLEAHQYWASNPQAELSESIYGKLLHFRIQQMRWDEYEAKAAAVKANADAAEAFQEEAKKLAASVAGKDKKPAVGKKPPGKEEVAAPAPVAPPEAVDGKKRQKLRDRVPGKGVDIRVQVVNDEPEDGPAGYLFLVDLATAGILSSLFASGTRLDALFRLHDATVTSNISSGLLSLKTAFVQSATDSPWKHVSWRDLLITGIREGNELFDVIAKQCYSILDLMRKYDKFYQPYHHIRVPTIPIDSLNMLNYPTYNAALDSYETDVVVSVELLLDALLDQVEKPASGDTPEATNQTMNDDSGLREDVLQHLDAYFDKTTAHLNFQDVALTTFKNRVTPTTASSFSSRHRNDATRKLGAYALSETKIHNSSAAAQNVLQSSQIFKIRQSEKFQQLLERTEREKQLSKSHLYWISKVPTPSLDRAVLQLELERVLSQKYPAVKWNLDDFCWTEALPADTLTQALQETSIAFPNVHMRYFSHEGVILVVLAADGDQKAPVTTADFVHKFDTKQSFGRFSSNLVDLNIYPTHETVSHGKSGYIYDFGSTLGSRQYVSTCFPSDGIQIRVTKEPSKAITMMGDSFVLTAGEKTVYFSNDGGRFGISVEGNAGKRVVLLQVDEHVLLQSAGNGCIAISYSSPQRRKILASLMSGAQIEINRTVTLQGSVIREFANGTYQVLKPNGTTLLHTSSDSWDLTSHDGSKLIVEGNTIKKATPIKVVCDFESSGSKVMWSREDGILYSEQKGKDGNGSFAKFRDGTIIETMVDAKSGERKFEIRHLSFPTISIEKGTIRVMLESGICVSLPGTVSEDSVEVRTNSYEVVRIASTGRVLFQARTGTTFEVNCEKQTLTVTDSVQNRFDIAGDIHMEATSLSTNASESPTTLQKPTDQMSLGTLISLEDGATFTRPYRGPRLFVVRPDGSGMELLRHDEVIAELKHAITVPSSSVLETQVSYDRESFAVSVMVPQKRLSSFYTEAKPPLFENSTFVVERRIVRHPKLSIQIRERVERDWSHLQTLMARKDQNTNSYIAEENIPNSAEGEALGSHVRQKMEELVHAESYLTRCMEEFVEQTQKLRDITVNTNPFANQMERVQKRLRELNKTKSATLQSEDGGSTFSVEIMRKERESMVLRAEVPKYFDSEDGRAFLQTQQPRDDNNTVKVCTNVDESVDAENKQHAPTEVAPTPIDVETEKELSTSKGGELRLSEQDVATIVQAKHAAIQPSQALPHKHGRSLVELDVFGRPRHTKIEVPASIKGEKPGLQANLRNLTIEGPKKRQLKTSSMASRRGVLLTSSFELHPGSVDFGKLREGETYSASIMMVNVGVEPIRFKLKQPDPASLVRIAYRPGPVAPGMSVELVFILRANEADIQPEQELRVVDLQVEVISEWEILHIPVYAEILSNEAYNAKTSHKKSATKEYPAGRDVRVVGT